MVAEGRAKRKEQRGKSGEQRLASLNLFLLSQVSNVKKILFEKIEDDTLASGVCKLNCVKAIFLIILPSDGRHDFNCVSHLRSLPGCKVT